MKILLLEPDEALRESFKGLLTQTAFVVDRCVLNGDEMLAAYAKAQPAAVVIDLNAPGHKDKPGDGGLAHLKRILDLDAGARIAVTYTLENKMFVMNALKAGALAKIKKPFRREEILEALAVCTGKTKSANVNRSGVRLKKALAVKYKKTTDGFFTRMRNGITDDISPTGISFRTEENLQEKTALKIELSLPGQTAAITAKGQVVRVKPVVGLPMLEIALTFTELANDDVDRLRSYILQNVAKATS